MPVNVKFLIPAATGTYLVYRVDADVGSREVHLENVVAWAMGAENEMYPVTVESGPEESIRVPILYPDGRVESGSGAIAASLEEMQNRINDFFPPS